MYNNLPTVDIEMTGKRIKELREKKHFTQKEVADYFGYTCVAVSRWETGKTVPKVDNLLALSDLFSVTIEDIVQRERSDNERGEAEKSPLPFSLNYRFIERNVNWLHNICCE